MPGRPTAGRPYFRHGAGPTALPITEFCDQQNADRFASGWSCSLSVCQAVQHAHQKGIIHRDLKPTNVMVTLHDGWPVAKVIDFGIAKAIGQQLTDRTLSIRRCAARRHPALHEPRASRAERSLDVDTRSDVYSLGVLLYELLTGTTPFDKETLKSAASTRCAGSSAKTSRRRVASARVEHARAQQAISTDLAATAASMRAALGDVLRGELDWIVMKALEKDRSRRYESAIRPRRRHSALSFRRTCPRLPPNYHVPLPKIRP